MFCRAILCPELRETHSSKTPVFSSRVMVNRIRGLIGSSTCCFMSRISVLLPEPHGTCRIRRKSVRSGGQLPSSISGSMNLADTEIYRIVVDDTDDYSGMEIEIPGSQYYEVDGLKWAQKVCPPSLPTQDVSNITLTTACAGGVICDDGGSDVLSFSFPVSFSN